VSIPASYRPIMKRTRAIGIHHLHSLHIKTSNKTRKTIAANLVQGERDGLQAEKRRQRKQVHPRVAQERRASGSAGETDTQNLNKRSYNNNTQNQSIHLRGCVHVQARDMWSVLDMIEPRKHTAALLLDVCPIPESHSTDRTPRARHFSPLFRQLLPVTSVLICMALSFFPPNESQSEPPKSIYIFFLHCSRKRRYAH